MAAWSRGGLTALLLSQICRQLRRFDRRFNQKTGYFTGTRRTRSRPVGFPFLAVIISARAIGRIENRKGILRMQIFTEELQDGITRVILEGRMDIEGASAIDLKLNIIGGTKAVVLVDMQGVSYLASIGIGLLITVAKAIRNKGGKFAFFAPSPVVDKVLQNTGIYQVIPVHYELEPAIAAMK